MPDDVWILDFFATSNDLRMIYESSAEFSNS